MDHGFCQKKPVFLTGTFVVAVHHARVIAEEKTLQKVSGQEYICRLKFSFQLQEHGYESLCL